MAWPDLQTYHHVCSVHESNFINIPLLIPAFCLFAAGLGGKILGGMNLGVSFLQESQAVLDICLLHNRSLWRALRPVTQERLEVQPAWRVSASEGQKDLRTGSFHSQVLSFGIRTEEVQQLPHHCWAGVMWRWEKRGEQGAPQNEAVILGPSLDGEGD